MLNKSNAYTLYLSCLRFLQNRYKENLHTQAEARLQLEDGHHVTSSLSISSLHSPPVLTEHGSHSGGSRSDGWEARDDLISPDLEVAEQVSFFY